ncbi:hypothetical protein ACHAXA_003920 [Cyclostephanos tholiformis]|uniref:Uncharacterized protein n=1 Tax=Cyclostephanos tholiformis TaxID=382380 RepID=A0ABD3RHU7_9STRA
MRDRFEYHRMKKVSSSSSSSTSAPADAIEAITPNGAKLAAMLENAKNSSWRENLINASDAQRRFMLPRGMDDNGDDDNMPEYVRRIDGRSREILRDERKRREEERRVEDDPARTRFWR